MKPIEFICGPAGHGKSFTLRQRLEADPLYATLTATTGIAAINLGEGVTTINSFLGFFDEESLKKAHSYGTPARRIVKMAERGYKNLVIDEVSMLPASYLTIIDEAFNNACNSIAARNNQGFYKDAVIEPGLILTGDFVQLPPVKGEFAFKSPAWSNVEVLRLTKNYRQSDPLFLDAINYARKGRGVDCASSLHKLGVKFTQQPNLMFEGTTLFGTNVQVNKFNHERLEMLESSNAFFKSAVRGIPKGEWKEIPAKVELKVGALVLVLANKPQTFEYVNGDLAEVISIAPGVEFTDSLNGEQVVENFEDCQSVRLRLKRNGYEFTLMKLTRQNLVDNLPANPPENFEPFWEAKKKQWVIGEVDYLPVRLGYASTIHKSQGLTLDSVQVDVRNPFVGQPAMFYVALSRVRTAQGLTIVGSPSLLASRVKTSQEVKEWV